MSLKLHTVFAVAALLGALWGSVARAEPELLDPLYERIASDLSGGAPLRVRVYVALCDNASQGIVPVKNPSICDGEAPERNIYWAAKGGLFGFMRQARYTLVEQVAFAEGVVAVRALWRKKVAVPPSLRGAHKGPIEVQVEGIAYRGREIRTAMLDFVRAVHDDSAQGPKTPHLIAYIGHDYFLDTTDVRSFQAARGTTSTLAKGVVALSCLGDRIIRPYITRQNAEVLLLNKNLAYPGAWALGGVIDGVARRASARAIHASAARAFALGMNKSVGTMLNAFAYGPKTE